jgi:hypothetical protein
MRKICLLFVVAIVSVFSISAQTNIKLTDGTDLIESVKSDSVGAKTEINPVKTIVETSKTDVSDKQKLEVSALVSLSTGNPLADAYIAEFSALFNVDPLLIYAQMSQESAFKAKATSSKGASGFMQLMPDTARRFGVTNIYSPKQNIKAGIKYMRWLLDKFGGDTRLALAGYNAGEGAVIKYGNKIPPYRETQEYVARIMTHYELMTNQNLAVARRDPQ